MSKARCGYLLGLVFLIGNSPLALAGPQFEYQCANTFPDDHQSIQYLVDSVPPGSDIRLKGICEFDPPIPGELPGRVSILRNDVTLRGPATIHGGEIPVRIGVQSISSISRAFCSDPDVNCVAVRNVSVERISFQSPSLFAMSIGAASGDVELSGNVIYSPRPVVLDFSRLTGLPFIEPFGGCINVSTIANSEPPDKRVEPGLVTGQITIQHNSCFGDASISDENDPDAILDYRTGAYTKGAYRGIYVANVDATISIQHNYIENTFEPAIFVNADSPLFSQRASLLRLSITDNIVNQVAPDIVAAGFFPVGVLTRLDPNVNLGPQFITKNSVLIDDQIVGLGVGIDSWGLSNFEIAKNDVAIMGAAVFSVGITVVSSRQGPSGPGLVSKNLVNGNTLVGILIGDGDPLFGNPPGLFGITTDVFLEKNDLSELITQFADVVFQSDSASNEFEGDFADSVLDFGTDNIITLK